MMIQDVGNALWYAHVGSGTTPILRDRLPLRRPISLAGAACSSSPSTGAILGLSAMLQAHVVHLVGLRRSLVRYYHALAKAGVAGASSSVGPNLRGPAFSDPSGERNF